MRVPNCPSQLTTSSSLLPPFPFRRARLPPSMRPPHQPIHSHDNAPHHWPPPPPTWPLASRTDSVKHDMRVGSMFSAGEANSDSDDRRDKAIALVSGVRRLAAKVPHLLPIPGNPAILDGTSCWMNDSVARFAVDCTAGSAASTDASVSCAVLSSDCLDEGDQGATPNGVSNASSTRSKCRR